MTTPWGVFPPRNLGRLADPWGREVEERLLRLRRASEAGGRYLKGQNRYSASSLGLIAQRLQALREGGLQLEQAALELQENLEAVPIVRQAYNYSNNFSVPTSGWTTRSTASLTVPEGKTRASIIVAGQSRLWDTGQDTPGGSLIWPFNPNTDVTSEYGPRNLTGNFHEGIDFGQGGALNGAPIPAAGDGVVHVNQTNFMGYGTTMMINHGALPNGYTVYTLYAHRQAVAGPAVGQPVSQGQIIGLIGSTGNVTGPHLHYEIHLVPPGGSLTWDYMNPSYDSPRTAVNPRDFMSSGGGTGGGSTEFTTLSGRLLLGGAVAPSVNADRPDAQSAQFTVSWGRQMTVTPGSTVSAQFQFLAGDFELVADARSYAALTMFGVFS